MSLNHGHSLHSIHTLTTPRWDFVNRTKYYFTSVDPSLSEASKQTQAFANLCSRTMHAHVLIQDKTGLLDKMNASVGYNDDAGVEFGKEIEDASIEFKRLAMAM